MQTAPAVRITEAEWEIMRVIWTNQPATSRFITEVLSEQMNWKSATVKTLIGRLVEKGFVSTKKQGKKYLYSAIISEEESINALATDIFEHICATKVGTTLAHQIEQATLSRDDIQFIENILQKKREQAVEKIFCDCLPGQCDCHNSYMKENENEKRNVHH